MHERKLIKDVLNEETFQNINSGYASNNGNTGYVMLSMIFKFFLQTGEYDFFIQRLKNAALTLEN